MYAWFSAMHTRVDLLLTGKPEIELKEVADIISLELKRLESIGNFFDSSSELSKLNQSAHLSPFTASKDLFEIISLSKEYHRKTLGYFDISIHSENYDSDTLDSIILNDKDLSIRFTRRGTKLDLSGFLKGYALDSIRKLLLGQEIKDALINLGNSSILALGNHPNGNGWKIGALIPNIKQKERALHDECFTTSGNETETRKHIINPKTGQYLEGVRTVSVLTKTGTDGEALATALCLAPPNVVPLIKTRF